MPYSGKKKDCPILIIFRYVRTEQLGQGTHRRPEIINNKDIYKRVVKKKIRQLVREGPDKRPSSYTP